MIYNGHTNCAFSYFFCYADKRNDIVNKVHVSAA